MSTSSPDDTPPPSELQGLDPKDLLQAGLETVPPVTLPPQPVDSDATIPVSRPQPTQPAAQVELPLPEELTTLLPGGNYHVASFLGQGGMGAVYKGMQVRLKRPVAIKIMRRDLGKDYDFEARFEREAQAMAKLNHPNIVSVIDFGEAGPDYLYIVMELIDGADLMDVIRGGQMTQEMALSLLPQVCDALQFAHDHGIVHRDIKPSNIMLTRDGRVKMCDFGLAKRYDVESSFRTQTGTGMGTPDYAAPEQFDPKANIDHRADIYALGVMIYQMITGQLPRGVWKPPSQRADIAPAWDDIVSRAMQSDPADRYQQASEVKTDVSSIPLAAKSDAGTPARPEKSGGAAAKKPEADKLRSREANVRAPVKSHAPLLFGIIGTVVVVALGTFFALRGKQSSPALQRVDAPPTPSASKSTAPQSTPATKASGDGLKPGTTLTAATPAPIAAAGLSESGWKPLFTEAEWRTSDPAHEFKDGLAHVQGGWRKPQSFPDGVIRAKLRYQETTQAAAIGLRDPNNLGGYSLGVGTPADTLYLIRRENSTNVNLTKLALPGLLKPGDTLILELRVQGNQISGRANDLVIGPVSDGTYKGAGQWGVMGRNASFESVEVQPLPAAASPSPAAAPALPESGWQPLFTEEEWQLPYKTTKKQSDGSTVPAVRSLENGLLHIQNNGFVKRQPAADAAIRTRIVLQPGSDTIAVVARHSGADGFYKWGTTTNDRVLTLIHFESSTNKSTTLGKHELSAPLRSGDKLELELRVQGNRLTALANGAVVIDTQDDRLKAAGGCGIDAHDGWFESVEVQPLPAAVARIKLWDTPEKLPKQKGVSWENGALRLDATTISYSNTTSRDVAFHATALVGSDQAGGVSLFIHHIPQKGSYALSLNGNAAEIRIAASGQPTRVLAKWPLTRRYRPDEWVRLEIRAEGARLTALVDGQILGSVEDRTLTETDRAQGGVSIAVVRTGYFKDIEYVPLAAPVVSPSPILPVSVSSSLVEPWQDVLHDPAKLQFTVNVERTADELRFSAGGVARVNDRPKDGAIRIRSVFAPINQALAWARDASAGHYTLSANSDGKAVRLACWLREGGTPSTTLREFPLPHPLQPGQEYELELRAVGSTLTARVDGELLGSVENSLFPTGGFAVQASSKQSDAPPLVVRALEFLDLDKPVPPSPNLPVSKSSVATATQAAPFTNTLGMKFVPVPETKVLFSIWDTRVQDYAAFAKAQEAAGKQLDGSWKTQEKDGVTVGREADHPVVGVSWEDAQVFCAWLTAKEIAEGKLTKGAKYRLPTDAEWSTAVGLPPELGATPEEKNGKNDVDYPWGKEWPPPNNAGNYADETFHAKFPPNENAKESWNKNQWLVSYTDGYVTTSPVGAFPANAYGLFDMGGNVWQLCEDWFNAEHKQRAVRGSPWHLSVRGNLRSSGRNHYEPTYRDRSVGFRCVLEPAPSTAAVSPSPNLPVSSLPIRSSHPASG